MKHIHTFRPFHGYLKTFFHILLGHSTVTNGHGFIFLNYGHSVVSSVYGFIFLISGHFIFAIGHGFTSISLLLVNI